ncbi:hypothetical protein WDJ51_01030 [Rathayibacter sp. YIM 133350]|uniref:hypothetical protein n=1 Tax=Rathayibacter sp. YIM 133350 TaxID=3131992 RepID=UPI00307F6B92
MNDAQGVAAQELAQQAVRERSVEAPVEKGGAGATWRGTPDQLRSHLTRSDPVLRLRATAALQRECGNAGVQRLIGSTPPVVSRQEDGAMQMPAESITGRDPNVVHLPEDSIKGTDKVDDETAKVMANIAATTTRAMGYLTDSKTEMIMAVDAFKGNAQSQIDALDFDPSDLVGLIPALVGAIGAVSGAIFPPIAGVAITINLVTALSTNVATTGAKAEGAAVKQRLKDGVAEFARKANDGGASVLNAAAPKLGPKLNEMAATEKGIWDMLVIGGERQQDDLISRLGVIDPKKSPPYGRVLAALMQAFGGWIAKEKFQKGMTGSERLVSEQVPYDESFRERKKAVDAGQAAAVEAARKMTEEHQGAAAQ